MADRTVSIRPTPAALHRISSLAFGASVLLSSLGVSRPAWAAPPAQESRELPDLGEGPGSVEEPSRELSEAVALPPRGEQPVPATRAEPEPASEAPAPRVDAVEGPLVRVGYGLSPESPGTSEELALLSQLSSSLRQGQRPARSVSEVPAGQDMGRRSCRSGTYDILIGVGHLPDRPEAVLVPYDCALGRPLGVRAGQAAADADLLEALWAEHEDLVARGVQDKRRGLTKKARTGLIAGGAAILIAGSITAILLGTLRTQTTVLKVEPE